MSTPLLPLTLRSGLAAGALTVLGLSLLPAVHAQSVTDQFFGAANPAGGQPNAVAPGDTFSIVLGGFNTGTDPNRTSGIFLTAPLTATFGQTQTFANSALNGQTVTVSSFETVSGGRTTDTITIGVPLNFVPVSTVDASGNVISRIELQMGQFSAGNNPLNFAQPIAGPAFSGTVLFGSPAAPQTGQPPVDGTVGNGGLTFAALEGVQTSDNSDISGLQVRQFSLSVSYVPEPSSVVLSALGGVAVLLGASKFRRRLA